MKKITELTEVRWRTIYIKDAYGNRHKDTEEFTAHRHVKGVSAGMRFGHLIIDGILFQAFLYIVQYVYEIFITISNLHVIVNLTFGLIAGITLLLFYPALYAICEYKWQKTPAKFLTKTVVIDEFGFKPDLRTIMLRSITRIVPFDPFTFFFDKFGRGWHDRWTKTWVVSEEELAEIKKLQQEQS